MRVRLSRTETVLLPRVLGLGVLLCVIGFIAISNMNEQTSNVETSLRWIERETLEYPNEKYRIVPNIARPDAERYSTGGSEIVICTQTSIENLHQVKGMSERWDGQISVAVFAYGEDITQALHYIMLLRKCSSDVRLKTSFHIVYPMGNPPRDLEAVRNLDFECGILESLRVSYGRENYRHALPYPVNVLRNAAIMYSRGTHVFNLDIDFITSKGMKKDCERFLDRRSSHEKLQKCAYVVPCFESNTSERVNTKSDLLRAVRTGSIRPFTVNKCNHCQANTDYSRWLALSYPREMTASYQVDYQPHYEPFYIAEKTHLPMFDGRFKQYGYNRFSQICETYVSGFDFFVMNNAFVIHDGFKERGTFYRWKAADNFANDYLFNMIFKKELKRKYPYSDRQCKV